MMPFLPILIAGIAMLVTRVAFHMPPNMPMFNFGTPWAVYDIFSILFIVAGIVGLVIRFSLISKAKR